MHCTAKKNSVNYLLLKWLG